MRPLHMSREQIKPLKVKPQLMMKIIVAEPLMGIPTITVMETEIVTEMKTTAAIKIVITVM